jgi:hypothetical protein
MLLEAAMFTTACTIAEEPSCSMSLMKQRSILILSNGKRDPHPDRAELVQDGKRGLIVADQHGLGDLDFEPVRLEPGSRERRRDPQRQRFAFQLHRGDVDREPDMRRPGGRFGASGAQHPVAELVDQADILRHRNELGG